MDTLKEFAQKNNNKLDLSEIARSLLENLINETMTEQAKELCAEEDTSRNGYRERTLTTAVGDIILKIPKLREGTYFPDEIIDRWSRTDTALVTTVAEMWTNGVSTRKVEKVISSLGVKKMSRSRVSRLCKMLDEEIKVLRAKDIAGYEWPYLWLDATYVYCRESAVANATAFVTAIAANNCGNREIIGFECFDTESEYSWRKFLLSLKNRGLDGVKLVISDEHAGLVNAIKKVLHGASHQRCIAHLERNLIDRARKKKYGAAAVACLKETFKETEPVLVKAGYRKAAEILRKYDEAGSDLLVDAEPEALAYLNFPKEHANWIRTNNISERTNAELKRRTRVVGVFPSVESVIRLVGASCCEHNEKWLTEKKFMSVSSMKAISSERQLMVPAKKLIDELKKRIETIFETTTKAA